MLVRFKLRNDPKAITAEEARRLAKIMTQAFRAGGASLKSRGRAAIRAALSARFAQGFSVKVYPLSGDSLAPRVFAYHRIKYAGQFDQPEPVSGALWLPIEQNLPGGTHWTVKKYLKVGRLRRGRRGTPGYRFLFGQVSVNRAGHVLKRPRKGSAIHLAWKPLFVLVRSVSDPKLYDMGTEGERVALEIGNKFSQMLESG